MRLKDQLSELLKQFPNIEVKQNETKVLLYYQKNRFEHECNKIEDISMLGRLLNILNNLLINHSDVEVTIDEIDSIDIHSKVLDLKFGINLVWCDYEFVNKILEITHYIKRHDKNIRIIVNHADILGVIALEHDEWRRPLTFGEELGEELEYGDNDFESLLNNILRENFHNIKNFFEFNYVDREYCYTDNYIEIPIEIGDSLFGPVSSQPDNLHKNGLTFEISRISEFFWNHSFREQQFDSEESYIDTCISTLKIYNLNKFLKIRLDDPSFLTVALNAAKNILFKLSHQYDAHLHIIQIPDYSDESYNDYHYSNMATLDNIDEHILLKLYDQDLINYYYRAINMIESEFKYLAYYQILECIFDEVHLHATVQDVKQIINSDWFSKHRDEDIKTVIEIVNTYNKNRNDREKLTLVLERYFKADLHDKAFLAANRSIIKILKEMNFIKDDKEFKDLRKIVEIIYDFRCKCTHSNRAFPIKKSPQNSDQQLSQYIKLIKKIAEKIIINYEKN